MADRRMAEVHMDALVAAIAAHGLAARGRTLADFARLLVADADSRHADQRGHPHRFSTHGNIFQMRGASETIWNTPLVEERAGGEPRTLRGGPRMCATLSSPGSNPPRRALDVAWIRIGEDAWLTRLAAAGVDDEPMALAIGGLDAPATARAATVGGPLSAAVAIPALAAPGAPDPTVIGWTDATADELTEETGWRMRNQRHARFAVALLAPSPTAVVAYDEGPRP